MVAARLLVGVPLTVEVGVTVKPLVGVLVSVTVALGVGVCDAIEPGEIQLVWALARFDVLFRWFTSHAHTPLDALCTRRSLGRSVMQQRR